MIFCQSPDFSVAITPSSQTVWQAGSSNYTVAITPSNGFTGAVSFSMSGLPTGASSVFSPTTITGSGSTTATVSATAGAGVTSATITVTASSGLLVHSATATLNITAPPPINYTYDALGRLTSVIDRSGNSAVYAYDSLGNLQSISRYSVNPAGTPAISPAPGVYSASETVSISSSTSGASIRYTIDGSVPTSSSGTVYTGSFSVSSTTTVRAIAYGAGPDSSVASSTYTIGSGPGWFDTAWARRKAITIDHTKVAGGSGLTNFPFLFAATDADLKTAANGGGVAQIGGGEIFFTGADGVTKLDHELEYYSPATGQLTAWIRIPSLAATSDTLVYMYYGNASAQPQQNPTGVWDSGYKGILHLDSFSNPSVQDSTGINHPTNDGAALVSGQIGGAGSLTGTQDVNLGAKFDGSNLTVSAWVNPQFSYNVATYPAVAGDLDNSGQHGWLLYYSGSLREWAMYSSYGTGTGSAAYSAAITSDAQLGKNSWHYLSGTISAGAAQIYMDGAAITSTSTTGTGTYSASLNNVQVGNSPDFSSSLGRWSGYIDEVRISNVARSAGWIGTEYNNQSSPSSFYSTGPAQGTGGIMVLSPTFSPGGGAYTATQTVTISTATSGASIRYKTDGSTPTCGSGTLYTGTLTITATTTIRSIACLSGAPDSSTASATYTISTGAGWYDTAWNYRKAVTIDHTKVSGSAALVNFAVVFSATDAGLKDVTHGGGTGRADGSDLLFTAADGTTKLDHELGSYDPTTGRTAAWVRIPSLSTVSDTVLYLYYGNGAATPQQNTAGVWDSGYQGVWHLDDSANLYSLDSTGHHNLTNQGAGTIPGQIGVAASFSGSQDLDTGSKYDGGTLTVSAWVNPQFSYGTSFYPVIAGDDDNSGLHGWALYYSSSLKAWGIYSSYGSGSPAYAYSSAISSDTQLGRNSWHYIAGTINAGTAQLYVDGIAATSSSGTGTGTYAASLKNVQIGNSPDFTSGFWQGYIDEARISNTARTADWIRTEFNNQSSPATFYAVGGIQNGPRVAAPTFSPAGGVYATSQTVTLSTATTGASIRYTVDGSVPSSSSGAIYTAAITITATTTVRAIAYAPSAPDSTISSATYTIGTGAAWYDTAWTNRKAITIDHTKITGSSSLANFALLFSVTDPNLRTLPNGGSVGMRDGADLLFTGSDGSSKLDHELESYNPATGQTVAWVRVPTVSTTTDTVIYLYYGNASSVSQQNKTGVWDSSYQGVWHLPNGVTLSANDSSSNAYNGTADGATAVAGQINGGAMFSGTQDIDTGHKFDGSSMTVSAWVNAQFSYTTSGYPAIAGALDNSGQHGWLLYYSGSLKKWVMDSSYGTGTSAVAAGAAIGSDAQLGKNSWHHIAGTVSGGVPQIYVDGALATATSTSGSGSYAASLSAVQIGNSPDFSSNLGRWTGYIDEVRISSSARSAAWLAAEYANQRSPGTFYTAGPAQSARASQVAAPTFSPAAGVYSTAVTVTISSTTSGAAIRYTTDGRIPSSTTGVPYTGAITVSATSTVRAIAYAPGAPDSEIGSATYTISTGAAWYDTAWTNRKAITIDHTKIAGSSSLTNFALLFSVTDANLKSITNGGKTGRLDGSDLLFTGADGASKLDHELEAYNPATGQTVAWVRVPSVSNTTDTVIYLYYGNSAAVGQQNKTGVWDSNYQGVWHLPNGTTLSAGDSSSNGNNGVIDGATAISGEINGAASLSGTQDVDTGHKFDGGNLTISAWVNPQFSYTTTKFPTIAGALDNNGLHGWSLYYSSYLKKWVIDSSYGTGTAAVASGSTITSDTQLGKNSWHLIAGTVSSGVAQIYIDGSAATVSATNGTGSYAASLSSVQIGNSPDFSSDLGRWTGYLDEVRISNTARSAGWLATEYNNQSSPGTFYSVGSQTSP